MIADLSSSHSFSMSSDTSGCCLNLEYILDANCFPTSLSSKASHLIQEVTDDLLDFLLAKVSKVARNLLPDGDQLKIQLLASLERPAHQKTNLTKLCKNYQRFLIHFRSIPSKLVNLSVLEKGILDAESVATTELQ